MVMMPNTAFLDFIFNSLIFIPTQISFKRLLKNGFECADGRALL